MSDTDHSPGDSGLAALVICVACLAGMLWIAVLSWPARDGLFATPGAASEPTASSSTHMRQRCQGLWDPSMARCTTSGAQSNTKPAAPVLRPEA